MNIKYLEIHYIYLKYVKVSNILVFYQNDGDNVYLKIDIEFHVLIII